MKHNFLINERVNVVYTIQPIHPLTYLIDLFIYKVYLYYISNELMDYVTCNNR